MARRKKMGALSTTEIALGGIALLGVIYLVTKKPATPTVPTVVTVPGGTSTAYNPYTAQVAETTALGADATSIANGIINLFN